MQSEWLLYSLNKILDNSSMSLEKLTKKETIIVRWKRRFLAEKNKVQVVETTEAGLQMFNWIMA